MCIISVAFSELLKFIFMYYNHGLKQRACLFDAGSNSVSTFDNIIVKVAPEIAICNYIRTECQTIKLHLIIAWAEPSM